MNFYEYDYLIGVDEVGRGSLAGPLVASAVAVKTANLSKLERIVDSKKQTQSQRIKNMRELFPCVEYFSVVSIPSAFIDRYGIKKANRFALEKALFSVLTRISPEKSSLVLVDHFHLQFSHPGARIYSFSHADSQFGIVSLAATLAKVLRDLCLTCLEELYPSYSFSCHKGYGTDGHLKELLISGPVKIHRKSFRPICQPKLFKQS